MPRTLGDGLIHMSNIDCMVENSEPLPEITPVSRTPQVNEIARLISDNLVEDGATIQTGILILSNLFMPQHQCQPFYAQASKDQG